jgi:hypothetical protein
MKRITLAAGLFSALACFSLQAQHLDSQVTVPFEFHMGKSMLPAGVYLVQHAGPAVIMKGIDGKHVSRMSLVTPASHNTAADRTTLEFNRYGDSYFLSSVWAPYSTDGLVLPKTKQEKELAVRVHFTTATAVALKQN